MACTDLMLRQFLNHTTFSELTLVQKVSRTYSAISVLASGVKSSVRGSS